MKKLFYIQKVSRFSEFRSVIPFNKSRSIMKSDIVASTLEVFVDCVWSILMVFLLFGFLLLTTLLLLFLCDFWYFWYRRRFNKTFFILRYYITRFFILLVDSCIIYWIWNSYFTLDLPLRYSPLGAMVEVKYLSMIFNKNKFTPKTKSGNSTRISRNKIPKIKKSKFLQKTRTNSNKIKCQKPNQKFIQN